MKFFKDSIPYSLGRNYNNSKSEIADSPTNAGFTIIELIVVLAVFMFIIGAAISIFISVIQNQKKVLAEQQVLNQISYVEEYMSKALRMATADISGNCLGVGNKGYIYLLTNYDQGSASFYGVKFLNNSDGVCNQFVWDSTNKVLTMVKNGNSIALTSSALGINSVKFSVNGSNGGTFTSASCQTSSQCGASNADIVQPRVTTIINIPANGQEPNRTIQTTVSQRNLNAKQ